MQEEPIIPPTHKKLIREELAQIAPIGWTRDMKKIFLLAFDEAPHCMREVTRLREMTFRKVGEGTGRERDYDPFDHHYRHLLLWDDKREEIIGSYRLGLVGEILPVHGQKGLITARKFAFGKAFEAYLPHCLELGRSFIQEAYWGTAALDYLWQGIGAFLSNRSDIRYMFGTVSMSGALPKQAKNLIVSYYLKWYGTDPSLASPYIPFEMSEEEKREAADVLTGENHRQDFVRLKKALRAFDATVPVLFRRYTDFTDFGGVQLTGFCVDVTFKNSVDGFMLVHMDRITREMKERYYNQQRSLGKDL